jgi:hypothetical protein
VDKLTAQSLGLRGPVKQCIERTTYQNAENPPVWTTTNSFTSEGKLQERRFSPRSGSDFVTTFFYTNGRLTRTSTSTDGGQQTEATYEYDQQGRRRSESSQGRDYGRYEYENGNRKEVREIPAFEQGSNTAIGTEPWEGGELSLVPVSGGTLITIYNEDDLPIEGQSKDASGRLISRIIRRYDDKGRILGDELMPGESSLPFPNGVALEMNNSQKAALAQLMQQAFATGRSSFTYDDQGRVKAKRIIDLRGDQVVSMEYDLQGNVVVEKTTTTPSHLMNSEFGMDEQGNLRTQSNSKTLPVTTTENHFTYKYDQHGNWTEKNMFSRSNSDGQLVPTITIQRTITYF